MCGICGFTGHRNDQKAVIERMMKSIEHRGPDSEGSFCGGEITLGFRRLSIIDLEDGQQPMESADGNLQIVFNGEIYDYKELRAELEAAGISFRTHSDTEVLVNTIQKYGEKALDKLRGMFGFAVWNEKEQTLMLARDFFGIKPVYYAQIDGHFVFASEIKSILAFPGYKREVNRLALEQYLSFQYSALEETFFKGIYKLMPGHVLIYRDGKYEIKSYFKARLTLGQWEESQENSNVGTRRDENVNELKENNPDMQPLQARLETILDDSVKHHMLSDVEVGAFLSGGVDSGYLAAASGADQAFTVGFDEGNRYNEVEKAAQVAKAAGLRHHVKIISKKEFWNSLPDVMYHMNEPSGDASAVALYFLAQEAAKHVKVVLSGEGADELFGGYNIYREPEALKMVGWIPFGIRRAVGRLAAKLPDVKGRDFLIRAGKKVEERFIGNAYIYGEKEKNQILKGGVTGQTTQEFLKPFYKEIENDRFLEKTDRTKHTHKVCRIEKKSGRDGLGKSHLQDMEKMQSVDLNYWLPGDILQKADKMSMAHSLEVRVPFLDKDVWTLAAGLPKEAKIADGTTKDIFRKAVSKYIPQDTDGRKKLGFPIPIRVWLRQDDWYQMVKELFTSKEAEEFFHTEKLLQLLREHKEGKKDNSRKIWTVLAFLIWHHTFFYKESSERQLQSN